MKKFFLITFSLAISLCLSAQTPKTVIFSKGENGFDTYRIPAVIQAKDGSLLAFAEARKHSMSDTGDIDLVLKRSTDGGKSWGEIITVWDDGANVCGNPSPVVDRKTGRIVLAATRNNGSDSEKDIHARVSNDTRRVFMMFSDDNGQTWSRPEDITVQAKLPEWTWYATGPCHAIQLENGRIIVPCNHGVFRDGKPAGTHSHVIYSDDCGQTWQMGGCPGIGNESTIAILGNGDLLLNMRGWRIDRAAHGYARIGAVSHDSGLSFEEHFFFSDLIEPSCNASMADYSPHGRHTGAILFSNPEHISKRVNMTVRISTDNGSTWKRIFTVTEGPAAYSDLCVMKNGDVGILYETGEDSAYETISFSTISRKALRKALRK